MQFFTVARARNSVCLTIPSPKCKNTLFVGSGSVTNPTNACSSADARSPQPPLKRGALTLPRLAPLFKGGWGDLALWKNGEGIV